MHDHSSKMVSILCKRRRGRMIHSVEPNQQSHVTRAKKQFDATWRKWNTVRFLQFKSIYRARANPCFHNFPANVALTVTGIRPIAVAVVIAVIVLFRLRQREMVDFQIITRKFRVTSARAIWNSDWGRGSSTCASNAHPIISVSIQCKASCFHSKRSSTIPTIRRTLGRIAKIAYKKIYRTKTCYVNCYCQMLNVVARMLDNN